MLTQFQSDCHQIWSFYGEAILMIIMDTNDNQDIHPYNPRCVGEFFRTSCIQPRSSFTLNRASPIYQGVGKDHRPGKCVHCKATMGEAMNANDLYSFLLLKT